MATRKTIASNRQAYHHYEIIAEYEAGIVLFGYEVKALRCFHASLNQAYISVHHGAPWLKNVIIKPFTGHHCFHAAPDRSRKLLLHQHELERIFLRQQQQRLFLVPLAMY